VAVFTRFGKRHPRIRMQLHDLLSSDQLAALARCELDVAFVGVAPERLPAGLAATRWQEEALLAFVPPNHPLASRREMRLAELAEEPFVTISAEAAPAFSSHVHHLCLEEGFRPRVVQEASRAQAVAALTVAGIRLAVLPASLERVTGNGIDLRRPRRRKAGVDHSVDPTARPGPPAARA